MLSSATDFEFIVVSVCVIIGDIIFCVHFVTSSFSLSQIVTEPTRVTNNSTLIDLADKRFLFYSQIGLQYRRHSRATGS